MPKLYTRSDALNRQMELTVRYGGREAKVAAFCEVGDAFAFARAKSLPTGYAEVTHSSGLVAQFENGRASAEFSHLDFEAAAA